MLRAARRALAAGLFDGPRYLLRDDFNDTLTAGNVNATASTPGPGTRTVVDTASKLSLSSGSLTYTPQATPVIGDPGLWLDAQTRVAGKMFFASVLPATNTARHYVGWHNAQTGAFENGFGAFFGHTGLLSSFQQVSSRSMDTYAGNTRYYLAVIMRSFNGLILAKGGAFTNWTLLGTYPESTNTTPLYPVVMSGNNGAGGISSDYLRVPRDLWLPTPLASDSFASTFAVTNGLGHPEATGPGAGGNGLTWVKVGTWGISSGKANCSALSGGLGIAHVPCGTPDVIVSAEVTRTAGSAGLVLRYTDANNYLYAYHDGTNAALIEVVGGTPANVIAPAAATYSAGRTLNVRLDGASAELYYNTVRVGTGGTTNILTGNSHGLWTNDTNPTFDNFQVYARGTGGEYNYLNRFLA